MCIIWKPTGDYSKIEMRTVVKKTFVNKTNKEKNCSNSLFL